MRGSPQAAILRARERRRERPKDLGASEREDLRQQQGQDRASAAQDRGQLQARITQLERDRDDLVADLADLETRVAALEGG